MGLKKSASVLVDSRTFRVFFISRIISVLGSVFARVALPLEVYNRSGSESLAAALTAVSLAPVLLVGIPAGVFADRRARVPMMRFCEAVFAVVVGVLALVLFLMGYVTLPVFSAVAVVSVASVLFDSASFALVPRMVGKDRLGQANSLIYGSNTVVSLIGPALGGIIYSTYGVVAVLAANFLAFTLSFICLLIVPSDRAPVHMDNVNASKSFLGDMREGIVVIFRSKLLAYLVLTGAAAAIAGGALTASLVILVAERLNMGGEVLGLLVSTIGGGAFLGSLLIASLSDTVGQLKVALVGFPLAAHRK